jgi:hypothetical protein
MILNDKELADRKKSLLESKECLKGRTGYHMFDTTLDYHDTISDKDTQIRRWQYEKEAVECLVEKSVNEQDAQYKEIQQLRQELLVLKAIQSDEGDCMDECMELRRQNEQLQVKLDKLKDCCGACLPHNDYQCPILARDRREGNLNKNVYISENV